MTETLHNMEKLKGIEFEHKEAFYIHTLHKPYFWFTVGLSHCFTVEWLSKMNKIYNWFKSYYHQAHMLWDWAAAIIWVELSGPLVINNTASLNA